MEVERTRHHFELDPDRFLYHTWHQFSGGLSNQQQCFQLSAILAIRYNRTLVLPKVGYRSNQYHDTNPVLIDKLFDMSQIPLDYHITEEDSIPSSYPRVNFEPDIFRPSWLLQDPFPNEPHLVMPCDWVYTFHSMDPDTIPYIQEVFFPYHPSFWNEARYYYRILQQKIGAVTGITARPPRLLSMQVRLGDRHCYPILTCPENAVLRPDKPRSNCAVPWSQEEEEEGGILEWPELLQTGLPVLSNTTASFDAIFIATNNLEEVRAAVQTYQTNNTKIPPVFSMSDLIGCDDGGGDAANLTNITGNVESVHRFVLEELICVLSDRVIPSMPSSITQILLERRLQEHHHNPDDRETYNTFVNMTIDFIRQRNEKTEHQGVAAAEASKKRKAMGFRRRRRRQNK